MDVAFLAPRRFRLDVRPDPISVPGVDADGPHLHRGHPATYQSGPTRTPATLAAECPTTRTIISHSSAYSAAAPLRRTSSLRRAPSGRRMASRWSAARMSTDTTRFASSVLCPRGPAVSVLAAGRHVAADVRRRPGRAVARHRRVVSRAVRGLPVDRSRAARLGDGFGCRTNGPRPRSWTSTAVGLERATRSLALRDPRPGPLAEVPLADASRRLGYAPAIRVTRGIWIWS